MQELATSKLFHTSSSMHIPWALMLMRECSIKKRSAGVHWCEPGKCLRVHWCDPGKCLRKLNYSFSMASTSGPRNQCFNDVLQGNSLWSCLGIAWFQYNAEICIEEMLQYASKLKRFLSVNVLIHKHHVCNIYVYWSLILSRLYPLTTIIKPSLEVNTMLSILPMLRRFLPHATIGQVVPVCCQIFCKIQYPHWEPATT